MPDALAARFARKCSGRPIELIMGAERKSVTLKEFARRLLTDEAAAGKRAGVSSPAAFRTWEKFRLPLDRMMGNAGLRSLFSRALALASAEVCWLRTLHLKADGSLEGLEELEEKLSAGEIARGETALVERLLELLVTFVGTALTLRLIQDVWPAGKFGRLDFGKGD